MSLDVDFLSFCFIAIIFIIVGWLSNEAYSEWSNERILDGLNLNNAQSHPEALSKAGEYDPDGDWVCVNIKGMKYKRALEVCSHEVGHEIFAEVCEKDFDKCLEVLEK